MEDACGDIVPREDPLVVSTRIIFVEAERAGAYQFIIIGEQEV